MNELKASLDRPIDFSGTDVAIGFFDGLHLGHRSILAHCRKDGKSPSLLSFDPESMVSFRKNGKVLYTSEERKWLFQENGIRNLYVLPFDERTRNSNPEYFLSFLRLSHPRRIVVGTDFTFGKMAKGKATDIEKALPTTEVLVVPLDSDSEGKISSTRVKSLVACGNLVEANRLLGENYFMIGEVVHGKRNGHRIGFPTANLAMLPTKLYPPVGVYKTKTWIDGIAYPSMTNIGTHPTIDEVEAKCVETHIPGFSENLYGKRIRLSFLEKIRDQKKFDSLEDLRKQLLIDLKKVLS